MRVFVAGATGAIGERLVPQLVERGHEVIGTSRSAERARKLEAQGAEGVVLDLLDAPAVRAAVLAARPDAIVHEGTALTGSLDTRHFDASFAATNRLRTAGTDALLAAAEEAGVSRIVALVLDEADAEHADAYRLREQRDKQRIDEKIGLGDAPEAKPVLKRVRL